jgi:hypothetical protein
MYLHSLAGVPGANITPAESAAINSRRSNVSSKILRNNARFFSTLRMPLTELPFLNMAIQLPLETQYPG